MKALSNILTVAVILTVVLGSTGFVLAQAGTTQASVYQLVK